MDRDDAENGSQATTNPADELPAVAVATELLNRTNALLSELESFDSLLEEHRRPPVLGLRAFIQDINAEKRFIERLLDKAVAETSPATNPEENGEDDEKDPLDALEADRKIKHQLSSTNVTSYEAQWSAIKTCRGVVALRQTFSRQPPSRRPQKGSKNIRALSPSSKIKAHVKKTQDGVLVDAVVDDGREWLKVSAISERQLLFQMARQGWRNDSDSDDEDGEVLGKPFGGADGGAAGAEDDDDDSDDDEDEVVILRLAKHLTQAARSNRHNYRHPRVRLVLPKIALGRVKEIDALLARIRALSTPAAPLSLETGATTPSNDDDDENGTATAQPDLTPLLTHPFSTFTPTLNIDCTLLVALASDISHARCTVQPWYPGAVQGQIRDEAREALLPTTLYPALLGGGDGDDVPAPALVCTREAARRMQEIVATIGTESEVARAGLLLFDPGEGGDHEGGEGGAAVADGLNISDDGSTTPQQHQPQPHHPPRRQALLAAFQALSIHPVPASLQLPITVVPSSAPTTPATETHPKLPKVAAAVSAQLTDINRSIFLHGWAEGITTLSSNGTVAKQMETLVEQHRTRDDEVGPDVWVCPVARSLVAKKGRRQG
ncbi:hypothetical protein SLS55_002634 [Diplodia seriata]|uniref:DUF1308 domain-containing protein n=1 Tax=Diplodia seriata TaxID=420778 RepID=A0ABR3CSQ8_9PEZI